MGKKQQARIFIASSHTASHLAQRLTNDLQKYASDHDIVPVPWWKEAEGSYILAALTQQTEVCDFAAILLTGTDFKEAGGIRDNCIYEAGLFAGALTDPKRCFLIVSVDQPELPSDLAGLIYIPIDEKDDASVMRAATRIGSAIDVFAKKGELHAVRGPRLSTASTEALACKDKLQNEGGILQPLSKNLFVNTFVADKRNAFLRRIMFNMQSGVEYTYVVEASESNLSVISKIPAALATISLPGTEPQNLEATLEVMEQYLGIYLIPDRSGLTLGIQSCILNMDDPYAAECYIRSPDVRPDASQREWIAWARGAEAVDIAGDISRMCSDDKYYRVFGATLYYELYGENAYCAAYRTRLASEVRRQFQQARDLLRDDKEGKLERCMRACFGPEFST